VTGIEAFRLHDGQIVEFWRMDDFLGLPQRLGAVAASGAAAAPRPPRRRAGRSGTAWPGSC